MISKHLGSLNQRQRKDHHSRISSENLRMIKRLKETWSAFNSEQWEKHRKTQEKFQQNIRKFATAQLNEDKKINRANSKII